MSARSLLLLVAAFGAGGLVALQQRRTLHLLQLEHYENARLFVWVRRRGELVAIPWAPIRAALAVAGTALALADGPVAAELAAVVLLLATLVPEAVSHLRRTEVKPLDYTQRAKRILAVAVLPAAALLVVAIALAFTVPAGAAVACLLTVALTLSPAPLTAAANALLRPWQRRINDRFVTAARAKLVEIGPRVIGVTGSFGKTTTKVCIGTVLDQRERTLITPASFNSFLGVVRTINERLLPEHRDFVVEMGMYRAGDIAELCDLVHPTIGVITAIGPAHLERLGSIEAIVDAKAELALALPSDGSLVTNADDERCLEIAARVTVETTLYGIENSRAHVRAEQLRMADGRTLFELVIGSGRTEVRAGLLGEHNVGNLLAAAAVGHLCGLGVEQIKLGLERVEPPEHRLQPLANPTAGIVVIDDAYNSNPVGAAAALKVLQGHPGRRRILVTPGMVELGDSEALENRAFGRLASEVCDHVILVGPRRTIPIREGLEAGGFGADRIDVVRDIAEATSVLARLTRAGDVVLFENDLPDMYAEDATPLARV